MIDSAREMHARAKSLFAVASDLPAEERAGFVARAAAGDAALESHVLRLLSALDSPDVFLRKPTAEGVRAGGDAPTADSSLGQGVSDRGVWGEEDVGSTIGPYKLLRVIGEGGFGRVFMAEQEHPVKRAVALKIIKLGMDTRQVVARFEQERQALALMNHPHIAKVLDGGATESGRPYFVMELCAGESITSYCDRNMLGIRDRLELFIQVCQAVQHAHQKQIIHRDIKPSNVLVSQHDGRAWAKVIDFGIAKATQQRLTERTLFTEQKQLIGTPEYMSPEQAEGAADIDTRTDVYSLGVLLYEILTGSTPFDSRELRVAAMDEIQRMIREVDPPNPSTRLSQQGERLAGIAATRKTEPRRLGSVIRGELDWIVMRALEKDRGRRYGSASDLAGELQRYLNGEAVSAAPPSLGYRVRKFSRRNRGGVLAGALVTAALVLGTIGTGVGFLRASAERDDAVAAREDSDAVTSYLVKVLSSADPGSMGKDVTIRQVIDQASQKLDPTIRERPGVESRVREAIGRTYLSLGEYGASEANLNQAYDLARAAYGEGSARALELDAAIARVLFVQGQVDAAESRANRILTEADRKFGPSSRAALGARNALADVYALTNRLAEAIPMYKGVIEDHPLVTEEDQQNVLNARGSLATVLAESGQFDEAEAMYKALDADATRILGPEHPTTLSNLNNHAWSLQRQGKHDLAVPIFEQVLETRRKILGPDHPHTRQVENNVAISYSRIGRLEESRVLQERALAGDRAQLGEKHPDTIISIANLAKFHLDHGSPERAEPLYVEAEAKAREVFGADHPYGAQTIALHGSCLLKLGRTDEGIAKLREAHGLFVKLGPTMARAALKSAGELAAAYESKGDAAAAAEWRKAAEAPSHAPK